MTLPCRSLALATLLVLILWITVSLAEDSPASWTEREQHRYSSELQTLRHKEQLALKAQKKASATERFAKRIEERKASPIPNRALENSTRALARFRLQIQQAESRLAAITRIQSAQTDGSGPLAVASELQGSVEVRTADGWIMLTPDRLLTPGEEIRTGADGKAEVLFNDGTLVNLHANSNFVLESEDDSLSSYRLGLGRVRALINQLGQRRYTFRTPTAICGVPGSVFLLETTEEGASALFVLRGEIEFGPVDQEQKVAVRQGERAMLQTDGTLEGPESFDLKTLQPWWK